MQCNRGLPSRHLSLISLQCDASFTLVYEYEKEHKYNVTVVGPTVIFLLFHFNYKINSCQCDTS